MLVAQSTQLLSDQSILEAEKTVNSQKTCVKQGQMYPLSMAGFQLEIVWKRLPPALSLGISLLRNSSKEYGPC